jgi:hypothetical protein
MPLHRCSLRTRRTSKRHECRAPRFKGALKDLEPDGTPTVPADGDDLAGGLNDEDGIVFGGVWTPGSAGLVVERYDWVTLANRPFSQP